MTQRTWIMMLLSITGRYLQNMRQLCSLKHALNFSCCSRKWKPLSSLKFATQNIFLWQCSGQSCQFQCGWSRMGEKRDYWFSGVWPVWLQVVLPSPRFCPNSDNYQKHHNCIKAQQKGHLCCFTVLHDIWPRLLWQHWLCKTNRA